MLIRSFGVDAGVDTRFGFFGSSACSGKLSRFVGDVYVAGVDAAAGGAVFAVSVAAVANGVIVVLTLRNINQAVPGPESAGRFCPIDSPLIATLAPMPKLLPS